MAYSTLLSLWTILLFKRVNSLHFGVGLFAGFPLLSRLVLSPELAFKHVNNNHKKLKKGATKRFETD